MGSNNNKPYFFYKHRTHSGSKFLNLMTLEERGGNSDPKRYRDIILNSNDKKGVLGILILIAIRA